MCLQRQDANQSDLKLLSGRVYATVTTANVLTEQRADKLLIKRCLIKSLSLSKVVVLTSKVTDAYTGGDS